MRLFDLTEKVAIVTGGNGGIGLGMAEGLADAGASIVLTGRNQEKAGAALKSLEKHGRTAHFVRADVTRAVECRTVVAEAVARFGRLDILVNNAFALPEDLTEPRPFWEKALSDWEMVDVGVRSNFVAAWHAAQIMVGQKSGLIVAISGYVGVTYTYGVVFGMCKTAVDRMAHDMAVELLPHNVASLSLWQGLTFTERAQRNLARDPAMQQLMVTKPAVGCSPEFPGRVIAALANDPDVIKRSGGTFITAEVARDYGVTDIDGRVIPSLRAERGSPIWRPVVEAGHGR